METTKRRSDAFPYQVFPFLETQTMPGGSKFNAKKGSILLDNLHLRPVPTMTITEEIITRTVRKDNTVLYKGNRYSVPLGRLIHIPQKKVINK